MMRGMCAAFAVLLAVILPDFGEAADAATATARKEGGMVKREGDRVQIEGVPVLWWGNAKACTWAGATEAALAPTAHPYSYAQIMEMSALAFRARWFRDKAGKGWCPSSAVGELGDEYQLFFRECGWQWRTEVRGGGADMTPLVPDVVKSIDAGLPVVCYDDHLDMAVAFGYTGGGKTLLFRDYHAGDKELDLPANKLGWLLYFPTAFTAAMPEREAALESLKLAVRNWTRDPMPGGNGGAYLYGRSALEGWAEDIGKADSCTPAEREKLFFLGWFCFDALDDASRSQKSFLDNVAKALGGKAADHLRSAAEVLGRTPPLTRGAFERKDAFLGPWSGKDIKAWTPEVRKREQDLLRRIATASDPVFTEMGKALAEAAKDAGR